MTTLMDSMAVQKKDREVEGNVERRIKRNMLLCKTGTIFTTHLDQIVLRNTKTATRRSEKSGSGRTDYTHTGWLGSHPVIKTVILKRTTGLV